MSQSINLSFRLTKEEFIKFNFYVLYRTLSMKILTVLSSLLLVIWSWLSILKYQAYGTLEVDFSFFALVPPLLIIAILMITYFRSKNNFDGQMISELIDFTIAYEGVRMKGETFDSTFSWDKVQMVQETKSWVFIWYNKMNVNVLPRKYLTPQDLATLKEIVANQPNVKNKLK